MKITTENTFNKQYIELLPTITIGWFKPLTISIMWLFWSIIIEFK